MIINMVGVRFHLVCWAFYFVVNKAEAGTEVRRLNYPVEDQRIRERRENHVDDVCIEKKGTTDRVHGFAYLTEDSYNVKFVYANGEHLVKVTWKAPSGKNNSLPIGYWFAWMVKHGNGDYSLICRVLFAENTSFVIHESEHWRKDENIQFSILPLPTNSPDDYPFSDLYFPIYEATRSTSKTETEASRSTSTSESTNGGKRSKTSAGNIVNSSEKQYREKEIFTIATVVISGAAIVSLLGFILALRYRRKKKRPARPANPRDSGYMYISYVSESESHIEKVSDFCTWLRKHGYNVQMDIMATQSNQEDLKELGRLRWGEKQLTRAKNVFIIVSPSYLNLCRLDEGENDGSSLTQGETIIYSEITQIRNELSSTAYISSRFIPVLFGVKETELPFWIKQLVVYNWPNDKTNDKLLYRVNEEVSYENKDITDTDIIASA